MKICWDNLEHLKYKNGRWLNENSISYYYVDSCENCREPFLKQKHYLGLFCSKSCAATGKFNKLYGKKHSEETKHKISLKKLSFYKNNTHPWLNRKHSEETKHKMSIKACQRIGELNPNWKGGISNYPYCSEWKYIRKELKESDNNECRNPMCESTSKRITSHHIDYDKQNCRPSNIITLCNSCNCKANKDRDWHKAFYTEIMRRESWLNN